MDDKTRNIGEFQLFLGWYLIVYKNIENWSETAQKRNGMRKSIQTLLINGKTITKREEIISQFTNHLSNKYNNFTDNLDHNEYIERNVTKNSKNKNEMNLFHLLNLALPLLQ